MSEEGKPAGPDLGQGVALADIADGGMLLGHAGGAAVLLARRGRELFAVGAECTHYHGPLAEGILVEDTVRCPWHHACFSLRTGKALRAPALNPVSCWRVEQQDGTVFVRDKLEPAVGRARSTRQPAPESVVIIGGGAAGEAAAEMLRREGYAGPVAMLSDDEAPPCDRPNLSKDYLAGNAPEEWIPLRPPEFYREQAIELRLGARVVAIRPDTREVELADGSRRRYGALLLATGAEPVRLGIPGNDLPNVYYLRTLADSRALIAAATAARRAVVIGASFIGLEVAASLRTRGLEVHVVAPEARPMEAVLGPEVSDLVRHLAPWHDLVGIRPQWGRTAERATARRRLRRRRRRGAAAHCARRRGRDRRRPRRHGERVPRDQYSGDLCRRRHHPLARPADRGTDPDRALGSCRTAGSDRRPQHPRRAQALRAGPVLLDPAA